MMGRELLQLLVPATVLPLRQQVLYPTILLILRYAMRRRGNPAVGSTPDPTVCTVIQPKRGKRRLSQQKKVNLAFAGLGIFLLSTSAIMLLFGKTRDDDYFTSSQLQQKLTKLKAVSILLQSASPVEFKGKETSSSKPDFLVALTRNDEIQWGYSSYSSKEALKVILRTKQSGFSPPLRRLHVDVVSQSVISPPGLFYGVVTVSSDLKPIQTLLPEEAWIRGMVQLLVSTTLNHHLDWQWDSIRDRRASGSTRYIYTETLRWEPVDPLHAKAPLQRLAGLHDKSSVETGVVRACDYLTSGRWMDAETSLIFLSSGDRAKQQLHVQTVHVYVASLVYHSSHLGRTRTVELRKVLSDAMDWILLNHVREDCAFINEPQWEGLCVVRKTIANISNPQKEFVPDAHALSILALSELLHDDVGFQAKYVPYVRRLAKYLLSAENGHGGIVSAPVNWNRRLDGSGGYEWKYEGFNNNRTLGLAALAWLRYVDAIGAVEDQEGALKGHNIEEESLLAAIRCINHVIEVSGDRRTTQDVDHWVLYAIAELDRMGHASDAQRAFAERQWNHVRKTSRKAGPLPYFCDNLRNGSFHATDRHESLPSVRIDLFSHRRCF